MELELHKISLENGLKKFAETVITNDLITEI